MWNTAVTHLVHERSLHVVLASVVEEQHDVSLERPEGVVLPLADPRSDDLSPPPAANTQGTNEPGRQTKRDISQTGGVKKEKIETKAVSPFLAHKSKHQNLSSA